MVIQLTIENLDTEVVERLRTEADRRGVDIAVVVNEVLKEGLHLVAKTSSGQTHHDLDALAGTWSAEEAESFLGGVANLRQIDEDMWK